MVDFASLIHPTVEIATGQNFTVKFTTTHLMHYHLIII